MQRDINTFIEDIVNEEIINAKKNIIIKIQEAFLTSGISDELFKVKDVPLHEIGFSVRVENALRRSGINSLKELVLCSRCDLLRVRNLGKKGRAELEALLLDKYGVTLSRCYYSVSNIRLNSRIKRRIWIHSYIHYSRLRSSC